MTTPSLPQGIETIKSHVHNMPAKPGVYRMLDTEGDVLYIGKAKDLSKRVANYTHPDRLPYRIKHMVALTRNMEILVTKTEAEALLLEANLIKTLKPKFNILLTDDKSYPYILITQDHTYPRIMKHRGNKDIKGKYFGPFVSASAVNRAIIDIQKAFLLRPCTDSFFSHRTRPCMEYQIKRCSAPCTQKITPGAYATNVKQAFSFLEGKSQHVQEELKKHMEDASNRMDYEEAAAYRDRIQALHHIQNRQFIFVDSIEEADIIALHQEEDMCCIQILFFRHHRLLGNKSFFFSHLTEPDAETLLESFLIQFYHQHTPPPLLLLSHAVPSITALEEALSSLVSYKVHITLPKSGDKYQVVATAQQNAQEAFLNKKNHRVQIGTQLSALAHCFGLPSPPQRIEVYDNSHISGKHAVGTMIVAGPGGFEKKSYRRYTIKGALTPGDDFAMLREVLTRRFGTAKKDGPSATDSVLPDFIIIDGGKGHARITEEILTALGLSIPFIAMAKGKERNAGKETFFGPQALPFSLPEKDPLLYYLQNLRDEAHRFAISNHRQKRHGQTTASLLDTIPGIGPKRKKALLTHFGSARGVADASVDALQQVTGIHKELAMHIYNYLH